MAWAAEVIIHHCLDNGKVSIEYDGIEHGIVDEFVRRGIPRQDIVFAFLPVEEPILVPA